MKFFALIGLFFLSFTGISCGNEYGHTLDGDRILTELFYLSDSYRSFNKETVQNALDIAIAKRGQQEDDYQNESNIALFYMKLGQTKKAIQILEILAREYPDEYTIMANLGTAYELNGQLNDALKYIKKGYEINPDSHLGSEWIHIKILEAKIKEKSNPSVLFDTPIISLEELEEHENSVDARRLNRRLFGEGLSNQLSVQIRTRVPFTPAPNKVIANLLKTLALYSEKHDSYENALMAHIYRLEFENSETRKSFVKKDLDALIKKIRSSPNNRLSPMFMDLIKAGDVDPGLMIYATDTVEFQLENAQFQKIATIDSFETLKLQVDSLKNVAKSKKQRIRIQPAAGNGFFWGMLFGTIGLILGILIASISARKKR